MSESKAGVPCNQTLQSGKRGGFTRRGLIGAALAGSAVIGDVRVASADTSPIETNVDVAILGAGFSGLAAARKIKDAGRSFVILEARDRVGGKVLNQPIGNGEITEAGATYIGPTQHRMSELAASYGIATFPTYFVGNPVYVIDGERLVGNIPSTLENEYLLFVKELTSLAAEVPVDNPARAPHSREWDSKTLHSWLEENGASPDVMKLFSSADLWGAETRDLSLLFVLSYIAGAGDPNTPGTLGRLLGVSGGAQELRFVGGSQLLAERMAADLREHILFSAPVRAINWNADGVVVTADGKTVKATRVIIAFAPALAARISYNPKLPTARAQFLQRYPMGSIIKVHAVYEQPFWRAVGLSGQALFTSGPIRTTFDNSPPDGKLGVLVGFVGGTIARHWDSLSPEERRSSVLTSFATAFGDEALNPTQYYEFDWPSEEWSRGAFVGYAGPGVLQDYAATRRAPVGPIHWAATETATYWNGYMEGAVQAGERAATEVLNSL